MQQTCFAIVPDDAPHATAMFRDLEDAIAWAVERHGSDAFAIRAIDVLEVEPASIKRAS
jgi:hypothetical protein